MNERSNHRRRTSVLKSEETRLSQAWELAYNCSRSVLTSLGGIEKQ